ncbi:MaoC family dehydratase [Amycolatopsis sp.]|uniref:MaoC family dehydratase n=1 Tax=Amycolatopsis sp. TaxID=37632 RepID=UPI002D10FC1B|nr:MaoC/PaaZ C-terminal domain-containing protein [Amycolatopsis sp.]HVV07970.1 MaoC/PaaZ C-terminal domain-containing protein [Amycolatopsis sp.]
MRKPVTATVGQSLPAGEAGPVTQTDIVRFAGAGGDFNPLHHDPEFARAAGFPGVLAMGQFQAGLLASWLTGWCGVEHLREYEVRFVAPVFLSDRLRFSGEVTAVEDGVAELALRASRGEDEIIRATAAVVVA